MEGNIKLRIQKKFYTTLGTVKCSADPVSLFIEMQENEFAKSLDHLGEGIMLGVRHLNRDSCGTCTIVSDWDKRR